MSVKLAQTHFPNIYIYTIVIIDYYLFETLLLKA
jgi:hypothetical protein